jgi:hypothetical protein
MTNDFWETDLLEEADYYKKVLLDGCIIKRRDVEICDLRVFHKRKINVSDSPRIQVYKMNKGGQEVVETHHNYNEAFFRFKELIAKG